MSRASSRTGSEVRARPVTAEPRGPRQTVDVGPLLLVLQEVLAGEQEGLFFRDILVRMQPKVTGLGSSLLSRVLKVARIKNKIISKTVGAQKKWRLLLESSESTVEQGGMVVNVVDRRSFLLVVASTTEERKPRRSQVVLDASATALQIKQAREKVAANLRKMTASCP